MNDWLPFLYAALAGLFTTAEATVNAKLGRLVTPKIATLHSLITGAIIILLANLAKGSLHQYKKVFSVSPQWLIGGIFGTCIVYLVTKTIPRLGITVTLTVVIASQVLSGLFIESFIIKQDQFELHNLIGVVLLMIAVYLIVD